MQISGSNADKFLIIILRLGIFPLINVKICQEIQNTPGIRLLLIDTQKDTLCLIVTAEPHIDLAYEAQNGIVPNTMDIHILQCILGFLIPALHNKRLDFLCQNTLINPIIIHFIYLPGEVKMSHKYPASDAAGCQERLDSKFV